MVVFTLTLTTNYLGIDVCTAEYRIHTKRGIWMESNFSEQANVGLADSVAVIATDDADNRFVQRLLHNVGYDGDLISCSSSHELSMIDHSAMIVCHRLSASSPLPDIPDCQAGQRVVVLSDCNAEQTIVNALEKGAHHFFNITEAPAVLQVRLEAALRQHAVQAKKELDVDPFRFNLERRNVYRDGKLVSLSPKEYEFAYYLFANRHRVVVNSELMTSVWSLPSSMDARRIDTAACRVRKKMQLSDSSNGWCLRRIRRVGYELLWCGDEQGEKPLKNTVQYRAGQFEHVAEATVLKPASSGKSYGTAEKQQQRNRFKETA